MDEKGKLIKRHLELEDVPSIVPTKKICEDNKSDIITKPTTSVLGDLLGSEIPYHKKFPETVPLTENLGSYSLVAFGLETTSLQLQCDIIQLTCVDLKNKKPPFSCYIKPKRSIEVEATKHNGLTFQRNRLRQNGRKVRAGKLKHGLEDLINYLDENTVLISHNTKQFQARRLVRSILLSGLKESFTKKVVGFIDSYSLYLELFPRDSTTQLPSYKLFRIIEHFSCNYNKGNFVCPEGKEQNLIKIQNLAKLISCNFENEHTPQKLYHHSITVEIAFEQIKHLNMKYSNGKTFKPLVDKKLLTGMMARKMASSGLILKNLVTAYNKAHYAGLLELLKPRITEKDTVVMKIFKYFEPTSTFEPLIQRKLLSEKMAWEMTSLGFTMQRLEAACKEGQYKGLLEFLKPKITKSDVVVKKIFKYFEPTSTFEPLIQEELLSKKMAWEMTSLGFTMQTLEAAYKEGQYNGLLQLLKPKITKSNAVVKKILKYFEPNSDDETAFEPLIQGELLSKKMASKMALSGITMQSLEAAYKEGQYTGLLELLNPKITKSAIVVKKILKYFEPNSDC